MTDVVVGHSPTGISFDVYTHADIAGVLTDVVPFENWLLPLVASSEGTWPTSVINFDQVYQDDRMAIFINPDKESKFSRKRGCETKQYTFAYIKEKDTVSTDIVMTRTPGEIISAPMSIQDRYQMALITLAQNQVLRMRRRYEWMAAQLMLTGEYDMIGEEISVNVDFARNAENTITRTSTAQWLPANVTTMTPYLDVEAGMNTCLEPVRNIIMGKAAYAAFRADPRFEKQVFINALRGDGMGLTFGLQQKLKTGVTYRGMLQDSGIHLWTYTRTYSDPATGVATLYIPTDAVIGLPDASWGQMLFGPIADPLNGYLPTEVFFTNWRTDDPPRPQLMSQAAPLLIHSKINSTFCIRTGASDSSVWT